MLIKLHNLIEDVIKTIGISDKIGIPAWVFNVIAWISGGVSLEFFHITVSDLEFINNLLKIIIQIGIAVFVYYKLYRVLKKGSDK